MIASCDRIFALRDRHLRLNIDNDGAPIGAGGANGVASMGR